MPYTPQRYDIRTFLIEIDSYVDGVPVGCYHNLCREEVVKFQSLTQLLLKLDQSLDAADQPQAFNKIRTFFPLTGYGLEVTDEVSPRSGKLASFAIHVLFRRNASWQGTLTWLNKGKVQNFRSVMELIALMDSALENICNNRRSTANSQWEDEEIWDEAMES